jgi:hypothetical protein
MDMFIVLISIRLHDDFHWAFVGPFLHKNVFNYKNVSNANIKYFIAV